MAQFLVFLSSNALSTCSPSVSFSLCLPALLRKVRPSHLVMLFVLRCAFFCSHTVFLSLADCVRTNTTFLLPTSRANNLELLLTQHAKRVRRSCVGLRVFCVIDPFFFPFFSFFF